MTEIEVTKVTLNDIDRLQKIGKQTFFETFSKSNSESDMAKYLSEGFSIDKKWLTGKINLFSNKSSNNNTDVNFFLTSYIFQFIETSKNRTNKRTGQKLKLRTIQDFEDTSNKLKLYEQKIGKRIKINEIDFYFSNIIAASSKTMNECKIAKQVLLKTGTDN